MPAQRLYCSIDAEELPDRAKWVGIKSLGMVTRERTVKEKRSTEIIYYISSCEVDAKLLAKCAREQVSDRDVDDMGKNMVFLDSLKRLAVLS